MTASLAPKSPRATIAAMRRRFEKWELEHLRSHAAELADKVERLQADLEYAENSAISWRDDCLRMMEESVPPSGAIGMTVSGSLHVLHPVNEDLVKALEGVIRVADRDTVEFDAARAALAKAKAGAV